MTDSLADQIRAQAAVSTRPGQLATLEAIADKVAELEAAQRPLLGYVAVARTSVTDRLLAYSRIHSTVDAVREWGRGKEIIVAELREVQP